MKVKEDVEDVEDMEDMELRYTKHVYYDAEVDMIFKTSEYHHNELSKDLSLPDLGFIYLGEL